MHTTQGRRKAIKDCLTRLFAGKAKEDIKLKTLFKYYSDNPMVLTGYIHQKLIFPWFVNITKKPG
jgi:hypothetical protein